MAVEIKQADYFISVPDTTLTTPTGNKFVQTQEIPVTIKEVTWPLHTFYAHFNIPPVELVAGGKSIETAAQRIQAQMMGHFEGYSKALNNPNPPLNAKGGLEIISQYFCLET